MLKYVFKTYRLHICDMFDEIPVMEVGVQLKACSSICNFIVVSLLYFYYEGVIQLWAMTWALGLQKWLKSQGRWHYIEKNNPLTLACLVVGSSIASFVEGFRAMG